MDATFASGQIGVPSQHVAESIAENLRRDAPGRFAHDVAILTCSSVDRISLDVAFAMDDTLFGGRNGLIHRNPRAQTATLDRLCG